MGRKTPENHEIAESLCGILDETGSETLKACIRHEKAQKAQNTCQSASCFPVLYVLVFDLRSGSVRRRLIQPAVDNHLHFNTTILLATGCGRVVSHCFRLAIAHRRDKPA